MRLDTAAARDRFADARVARLATADATGQPHLVPITFALSGDRLWTAVDHKPKSTAALRRLRNIAAQPRVSVLVDHYDDDWDLLWWVRADGTAHVLEDAASRRPPVAALSARYPQYRRQPPDGPVIVVDIHTWRGWAATRQ